MDSFIRCIMKLPSSAQVELMQIIQEWKNIEEESKEDDSKLSEYRQAIDHLECQYQNILQENASLRASLDEEY